MLATCLQNISFALDSGAPTINEHCFNFYATITANPVINLSEGDSVLNQGVSSTCPGIDILTD
jgi:hypothetical protein